MTANMSFTNAPDQELLGSVAGALGVDEAFVEKDWFVVRAIGILLAAETEHLKPVFSGGTSLLKGHGLIRRFSEDIDFKLALSPEFEGKSQGQRRRPLSAFKNAVASAWADAGFKVEITRVGSGNAFFQIDMDYPTRLEPHESLRPHIQAEISAKPPRLPPIERPVISFVSQYRGARPEAPSVPCVDPVETAADKLSAFCWRMLTRERGGEKDDPAIIRHLHDLAALEAAATASPAFGALLLETLVADTGRGGDAMAAMSPQARLAAMEARLREDALYADEYGRFVGGMAFAGEPEIPSFEEAIAATSRLCRMLPS
jgi:hypothetical protein